MANLLAIITVHVFLFVLCFDIRTLRNEGGLLVKLLIAGALGISISRLLDPVFGGDLDTIFSRSMYTLSRLFNLDIPTQSANGNTNVGLPLAVGYFSIHSVFYVLYYFFSAQILEGILLGYLNLFYSHVALTLFVGSVVYDVLIL